MSGPLYPEPTSPSAAQSIAGLNVSQATESRSLELLDSLTRRKRLGGRFGLTNVDYSENIVLVGEESSARNLVLDLAQQIASKAGGAKSDTVARAARGALLGQLRTLAKQATAENWDGYGAYPVSIRAYEYAQRFVLLLPAALADPEPSIDSDGDIALEWYRGPRRVFSVSISGEGILTYAGLFGANKTHGTEQFAEGVPDSIALGIARVLGEASPL